MTVDDSGPLSGFLVVSVEHAVAAPLASRHLADLGARVVKVERPDGGDFARSYDQSVDGLSSFFVWANHSKESIALNLKHDHARLLLDRLLGTADVFLHNLTAGAADRLDLSAEAVLGRHPQLVTCSVSGYGDGGPFSGRKAYDLLIQAEAGLLDITGTPREPSKVGISIADIAAGMYAVNGILAGLVQRARTGRGSHVPVVMLDALAEWMSAPLYFSHYGGQAPVRGGARHATIAPYGPFRTRDGDSVVLAVQNDREWQRFCRVVLRDEEIGEAPQFATNSARVANGAELTALLDTKLGGLAKDSLLERLQRADIAYGDLNPVSAVWDHPQLTARDRFVEVATEKGPVTVLRPPGRGHREPGAVPALGEHTDAVLDDLGVSLAGREQLREWGAVG